MLDMEKVIQGLELCTNISPDGCLMLCPYKDEKDETYSGFCEQVLKQDAIALLKEQEPVEHIYGSHGERRCGVCRNKFFVYGQLYCASCGRQAKWDG